MHQNINLKFFSETLHEEVEKSIMMYLHANIETKMDAYFKKVLAHPDARIMITANLERNKDGKFDGRFTFVLDGKTLRYERMGSDSFRNVHDLVNHAFDHLKEQLAHEKDVASVQKRYSLIN